MSESECPTVLYVDVDTRACEVVRTALSLTPGVKVCTASSGEEAIALLSKLRVDLVLIDATLPGPDGPAIFERLRESKMIDDIPVIFLSAQVSPADVEHFVRLGGLGVIGKPIDPLTLGNQVMKLLCSHDTDVRSRADEPSAQSHAPVDSLAKKFLLRTRVDVERLSELVNCAVNGDGSMLDESERICHTIHGAGAMFGYLQLSQAAGAMERQLEDILRSVAVTPLADSAALISLVGCAEELARVLSTAEGLVPVENCMFQE